MKIEESSYRNCLGEGKGGGTVSDFIVRYTASVRFKPINYYGFAIFLIHRVSRKTLACVKFL
jgi:hypothetical protein